MAQNRLHGISQVEAVLVNVLGGFFKGKLDLPHKAAVGTAAWSQGVVGALEPSLDLAGGRTAIPASLVAVIALVLDQQPVPTNLLALVGFLVGIVAGLSADELRARLAGIVDVLIIADADALVCGCVQVSAVVGAIAILALVVVGPSAVEARGVARQAGD